MTAEIKTEDQQQPAPPPKNWAKRGLIITLFALAIFICAVSVGFFQMINNNLVLARQVASLREVQDTQQQNMITLQNTVDKEDQALASARALSQEQARLVAEWRAAQKGDLAKWQVAESQYLVKLANDHLQFNHDVDTAKLLLQRADQTLSNLKDPRLLELRKSIANNLAQIDSLSRMNTTDLYLRINALDQQIDQLPLPQNPLKPAIPNTASNSVTSNVNSETSSWWQQGLTHAWQGLRQIVIVRKIGTDALPLTFPEEKLFLYQNVHAQISNMLWAVLHQKNVVLQTSLQRTIAWIKAYFVQEDPATQNMLQNFLALQQINIDPPNINLSATLKLFDDYFSQEPAVSQP